MICASELLTIKNYAKHKGVSVQAVYKMVREDRVNTEIVDGVVFVIYPEGVSIDEIYSVYVLTNNDTPVYVGYTLDIDTRIKSHRNDGKEFTGHVILKTYLNKQDSLIAENAVIRYLSAFGNKENINLQKYFV